jgi:dTDP-4-amino-4,6-dideoxygalactose transaminase
VRIPFNRPAPAGRERQYLDAVIESAHWSGDGVFTRRASAWLESHVGVPCALLTTSCTHALEMAALLLDLKSGDDVIMPSFTFVSTANAVVLRGARPVFVDIRPDTLNIDERAIESAVTARTRAIVVVHYAGVACAMEEILACAARHGLSVIEDNAHGLFGRHRGRALGSIGRVATLSFHETKNVSCGEGGALLLTDSTLIDRAEILREKGTNRSRFFRGQVDKYTWVDEGSSYLLAEPLAAVLLAQLEASETTQARRLAIWNRYAQELQEWATRYLVRLPIVPADCEHPAHMFYLLLPSERDRRSLIEHLKVRDILAVFHYLPLHLSPMGRRRGHAPMPLPVTEAVSDRLLRLPLFAGLTDAEVTDVIEAVQAWTPAVSAVR